MSTMEPMRASPPGAVAYLTESMGGEISGDVMSHDVECTHCHVLMATCAAAGSPVRYWQCPFCNRTHSSRYSAVFRRGAGAGRVEPAPAPAAVLAAGAPQATPEDIAWTRLKARAAR